MTTISEPRALWSTMPGWGIVANLLPPEIVQARHVKRLRRVVVAALIFVVLVAGGGYAYAFLQANSAQQDLSVAQSRTTALTMQTHKYAGVTLMQSDVSQIKSQLGALMASDIDAAKLLSTIIGSAPSGTTLSQLTLQMNVPASAGGTLTASGQSNVSLDTSGNTHIGTMTIHGTARQLQDVATYLNTLSSLPGVVDVIPGSNLHDSNGWTFTIALNLTDVLHTNRYHIGGN